MPNHKPKISVIVPIYGVEKYLRQCVDSILAQTLKDIEIILVDDGSKDKCPDMVDQYALKDKRVVPVHQPNGGEGKAINTGICIAKGEYIGIVEPDDWIEPNMYELLYQNALKFGTDITKGGFYIYNSQLLPQEQNKVYQYDHQDLNKAPDGVFDIKMYPQLMLFHASIWSSIYKIDFLKGQKFVETKSASYQDFPFMIEVLCRARRISVVKKALVHYRVENGQNSSTMRRDERLLLMPQQCIEGKKILQKYGKYELLKEEFYYHSYGACKNFYDKIYFKYKKAYFNFLHLLFADLKTDRTFLYKYFNHKSKKFVTYCVNNQFLKSLINLKNIRKFLISIHLRKGIHLQFLGIQVTTRTDPPPLLFA